MVRVSRGDYLGAVSPFPAGFAPAGPFAPGFGTWKRYRAGGGGTYGGGTGLGAGGVGAAGCGKTAVEVLFTPEYTSTTTGGGVGFGGGQLYDCGNAATKG